MGLIAIGDIHGCVDTLNRLLERLSLEQDDHLVFIGDYIDRGSSSKRVIDRLLEIQSAYECTFLRGNHETLMLDYLDYGRIDTWRLNGGLATLHSYVKTNKKVEIPNDHIQFLRNTVSFYETDQFFFVHAGLKPHLTIEEQKERFDDNVFLWERSHLKAKTIAWEKTVVCGHTPHPEPINKPHLIAIDTGCVYTNHAKLGQLTAVRLPERTFLTVKNVESRNL